MRPTYCWIHQRHETPGYLRCFECGHWYATPEELVSDFNASMAYVGSDPEIDPDAIMFCAHCSHDF